MASQHARGIDLDYLSVSEISSKTSVADHKISPSGRISGPCVTVFTSDEEALTKRFFLNNGAIEKQSLATLYAGRAETRAAPTVQALSEILDGLTHRQALSSGRLKTADRAKVTTHDKVAARPGYVARSLEHFAFDQAPGWLLWDFDNKQMPQDVAARIEALGGPLEALFHIWPEAREAAYLVRPSSSGGVSGPGLAETGSNGLHGFFLVQDVSQSKAILTALQARAWVAGLAWFALSKRGDLLPRSIVDTSVGSPERLIFEAPPIVVAPLTRTARPAIIGGGSEAAATPSAPLDEARPLENAARLAIKPQAAKAEAEYVEDRAAIIAAKTGKSMSQARDAVRAMAEGSVLADDDILQLKSGAWARVGDLLDDPQNNRLALPDPIEGLAYGSDKATLFLTPRPERPDDKPILVSHAHGQRVVYRFARYGEQKRVVLPRPADLPDSKLKTLEAALKACATPEEPANTLAVALAVAYRLLRRVPVEMSIEGVLAFITGHLPSDALTKAEQDAVKDRLAWMQDKRKKTALDHVTLPTSVSLGHTLRRVQTLEALPAETLHGVICIRAPMASGKTQRIGKPFVQWAKAQGGGVMAICHRVTLTNELSRRLDLADYQNTTAESIAEKGGVAVCLPSTTLEWMADALQKPRFVFVDEIAQVLQFIAAEGHCRTRNASAEGVFNRLVQIVRDAEVVLVADAGLDARSIRFLEHCRPGERFQVIEMQAENDGKQAEVITGPQPNEVKQAVADRVLSELGLGGKAWVATESRDLAEALEALFSGEGFKAISITASNKGEDLQAAFLKNAESASRLYDVVIASPAISSGLSIEHADAPHFTLGAYIGSGSATAPSDAVQQLGRVRYLRRFAIGIMRNNLSGGQTWEAIVDGLQGAAAIEGKPTIATTFDGMVSDVEAQAANAKADFGAGLWWMLESQRWTLERSVAGTDGSGSVKAAKAALDAAHRHALKGADLIDSATAGMLRESTTRSAADDLRLEAWEIRNFFGVVDLDDEAIDFWDGGRGVSRLKRFEDLIGADVERYDDSEKTLVHRAHRNARMQIYQELFAGFDVSSTDWCGPVAAGVIVDRAMARANVLAALGIIGPKYRAQFVGKGGKPKAAARPTGRAATWMVKDILYRAGLEWTSTRARLSQTPPFLVNTNRGVWDSAEVSDDNRQYVGGTCPDSFAQMSALVARRAVFDLDRHITAAAFALADWESDFVEVETLSATLLEIAMQGLSIERRGWTPPLSIHAPPPRPIERLCYA